MARIDLMDTGMSAVMKMVDGNPGAMMALIEMMEKYPSIDPQSAFGPLTPVLSLDTHGIYGSEIYILFSDKCGRDVRKMALLLRAVQLGFRSSSWLKALARDQCHQNNIDDEKWKQIDDLVCGELSEFQRAD